MYAISPWGAALRGWAAGLVGSFAQNVYLERVKIEAPPKRPFQPPEPQQSEETSTQTVARRYVETMLQRGPLRAEHKAQAGKLVHYWFGGEWGAAYGMTRESAPFLCSPLGVLGFSAFVWALSDNLLLPLHRLSGWPADYPLKTHAHALAAHVVYGAAVAATYELARVSPIRLLGAALVALGLRPRPRRPMRARLRPAARKVFDAAMTAAVRPLAIRGPAEAHAG